MNGYRVHPFWLGIKYICNGLESIFNGDIHIGRGEVGLLQLIEEIHRSDSFSSRATVLLVSVRVNTDGAYYHTSECFHVHVCSA